MGKIKREYRETLAFIRQYLKWPLLICAVTLLSGIILGAVIGTVNPEVITQILNEFTQMVQENGIVSADGAISMAGLLANNWRAMLVTVILGFVPFLFLPAVNLIPNGLLIGILGSLYGAGGLGLFLAGILPHGIFELTALLLSAACGVALCKNMRLVVTSNPERIPLVEFLYDILRVILLIIAPLTVIAAAVEAYVTPAIMSLFL